MSEFKVGQRVKVSIPEFYGEVVYVYEEGVGAIDVHPEGDWPVDDPWGGNLALEYIPAEHVTAAPSELDYWPPQLGDVWEGGDGTEWFIVSDYVSSSNLVAIPSTERRGSIGYRAFDGSLKPQVSRLVRRRGLAL